MYVDQMGYHPLIFLLITTAVVVGFAVWGAFQGASLSQKVEGNIDMSLPNKPNQPNEPNEDNALTADDIAMNIAMGALAYAHVGAVIVSGVGAVYAFADLVSGGQLFAFGALYSIALSLFLIPFGMAVKNPELDPNDMPKVDLPTFK